MPFIQRYAILYIHHPNPFPILSAVGRKVAEKREATDKSTSLFNNTSIRTMRISLYAALFALFVVAFAPTPTLYAQKKGKSKGKAGTSTKTGLDPLSRDKSDRLFFDGIAATLKNNLDGAITAFKACLEINPKNDAAMYELSRIYLEKEDREQALSYIRQATQADPSNKWYQLLLAETYAFNNDYEPAAAAYRQIIDNNPEDIENYFDYAYMLIRAGKYADAIKAYDQLESKVGIIEDIVLQKQQLYIQLGDSPKAIAELEKLVAHNPSETRYYVDLAELYKINKMDDKALATYQRMLAAAPDNAETRLVMANYYRTQGNMTQYFAELKAAFKHPELPIAAKAKELERFVGKMESDTAVRKEVFDLVGIVAKAHPEEPMAHILYGDLLNTYKRPQEALSAFKKAIELDKKSRFEIWRQVLFVEYEINNYQLLATDSKKAIELFPDQYLPYYLNGIANQRLQNYEAAVKSLKRAVIMVGSEEEFVVQISNTLGDVYNSMKDYPNSDKCFQKVLELDPDNLLALNNYSYFLSLRKENLDKAAEMSLKSNTLEANNPSYLDTYAWILYQQKKYADARTYIEKAIAAGGSNSGTILEHYGDILFQLGKGDEAVQQWQKAKQSGEYSGLLDKKLRDKKMYE